MIVNKCRERQVFGPVIGSLQCDFFDSYHSYHERCSTVANQAILSDTKRKHKKRIVTTRVAQNACFGTGNYRHDGTDYCDMYVHIDTDV